MNAALLTSPPRAHQSPDSCPPNASLRLDGPERYERELAEIAREQGDRLLAVARRFLRCDDDAADAVQDAFVSAFQALPHFQGGSELSTWLHRILVNACLMKLRSRPKQAAVSLDALMPQFDESGRHAWRVSTGRRVSQHPMERDELRALVRHCIDRLPDGYREVVLLRDIEQLNTEDTAAMLGVAAGTVKTRLHRARQALRTLLEPILADEDELAADSLDRNQFAAAASKTTAT